MKKRSILFIILLITISIVNILKPTKVFSNKENRYLEVFPKLNLRTIMSGEFASNFEKYATDQFIYRDNWISLKTLSQLALLKKDNGRVYFGKEGYLFDIDSKVDEEQFIMNIKNLNIFSNNLKEYDENIKITALLIPTKTEVLKEKLPIYAPVVNEVELLEQIKLNLNNIQVVDLIDILRGHSNEYIYYKTDHHWTTKGAFYGYEYYLNILGGVSLKEFGFNIEQVSDDFYGTSYRKANFYYGTPDEIFSYSSKEDISYEITINNSIKTDHLYDDSYLSKTDKYSYFLGGDKALIEINTSIKNDKTLIVIKDSFANSILPFLLNHYENIIVIDTRYFNGSISDYIKGRDVDEVLLLYNIQNFVKEKSFLKFGL